MKQAPAFRNIALPAILSTFALSFVGCGIGSPAIAVAPQIAPVSGTIFGGQQPVVGSVVTLMAASTAAYGAPPAILATTTSVAGGQYTLPSHICPTPDSLVYVEAVGGDSGTGAGTPNTAIDLVNIVGNCSAATSSTVINLNEATTIAAAYVLAPFANTSTAVIGIGTSPTNIVGLNNAAGPAHTLVNPTNGLVNPTSASAGLVLPSTLVNTLADILAACVNTPLATSDNCNTLFNATNYGFKPASTFAAALNIALHPSSNTATLLSLVSSTAPFQPTVATNTPPTDFTLAIAYNGGGIAPRGVNAVAIDASGNAWVTDYYTNSTGSISGLIEITPTGTYPGGATGFGNAFLGPMNNLAIDEGGTIWVDNTGLSAITGVNPNGTLFATFNNVNTPNGIAIDGSADIWYSSGGNANNTTYEIANLGSGNYGNGSTFASVSHFGVDVCIAGGFVYNISYGANNEASSVTQFNHNSSASANGTIASVVPDGGNSGLSGCAVDSTGNLWLANFGPANNIEVYTPSLTLSKSIAVNPAVYPQEVALDGLGNVFVPTYVPHGTASYNSGATNPASLVEFTNSGTLVSPAVGYLPTTGQANSTNTGLVGLTSQQVAPGGVAIDASGNVWLTGNDGQSVPSSGNVNTGNLPAYVTEIIGIAAPVLTPKSVALSEGRIATRP